MSEFGGDTTVSVGESVERTGQAKQFEPGRGCCPRLIREECPTRVRDCGARLCLAVFCRRLYQPSRTTPF
jgi:hypothetical protein